MKSKNILEYVKSNPYQILIFVAAAFLSCNGDFTLDTIIFFILGFIREYRQYNSHLEFLHKQGLTAQQYVDKTFYQEWAETRVNGITHYCMHNGGIISGSMLSIFFGAVFIGTKAFGDINSDFSIMVAIIWKSWLTGSLACTVLYRYLWVLNERRFKEIHPHQLPLQNFSTAIPR